MMERGKTFWVAKVLKTIQCCDSAMTTPASVAGLRADLFVVTGLLHAASAAAAALSYEARRTPTAQDKCQTTFAF